MRKIIKIIDVTLKIIGPVLLFVSGAIYLQVFQSAEISMPPSLVHPEAVNMEKESSALLNWKAVTYEVEAPAESMEVRDYIYAELGRMGWSKYVTSPLLHGGGDEWTVSTKYNSDEKHLSILNHWLSPDGNKALNLNIDSVKDLSKSGDAPALQVVSLKIVPLIEGKTIPLTLGAVMSGIFGLTLVLYSLGGLAQLKRGRAA